MRRRWRQVAAIVTLGCVAGCDSPKPQATTTLDDGTVALSHAGLIDDSLHGILVAATPAIGDPRYMAVEGSTLWIADRSGDPFLHLIDVGADTVLESRGRSGEGPGDYGEVPQLTRRPGDTAAIWTYDARLRRLTREPRDASVDRRVIPMFGDDIEYAWALQWRDAAHLVGIGDLDTNRVILADSTGALISLVPNALLGPDSASVEARRAISSGYVLCVQPDGGRFAVLYLAAGQIDLYQPDGVHTAMAEVPFASDGQWVINKRGQLWFKVEWNYYVGCAGTSRFLYALFTGQRIDGPAGPQARQALHVHVFDWEGRRRAIWALDAPASTIAVSGDTVLFATGQDGVGVFRYRLPEVR